VIQNKIADKRADQSLCSVQADPFSKTNGVRLGEMGNMKDSHDGAFRPEALTPAELDEAAHNP